mmetsp:Transcript_9025/g.13138  ORF Transcript_9025/g.13138 Transcript_9025/m.13138 type:complete len:86 (-) Transcript_9025:28-285(-)
MVGFWDSQKKLVADDYSSVLYLRLEPKDVVRWWANDDDADGNNDEDSYASSTTLIAGDGVHPNAKCYELWAKSLGEKILKQHCSK